MSEIMKRGPLLQKIRELAFCMYDLNLYLDTHPHDEDALTLYHKYHKQYDTMLQMYCCNYGPLNTNEVTAETVWTWINDPWPWEGGGC